MNRLYTLQAAQHWQRRAQVSLWLSLGLMAAATAVCILLCTQLTTLNTQRRLLTDIILFALAGWVSMLVLYFVYAPARAQASHITGMLAAEPEAHEGVLELRRETFRIPKSITVRKVCLHTDEGDLTLSISASLSHQLPQEQRLRVWTVRKYITAYEVLK